MGAVAAVRGVDGVDPAAVQLDDGDEPRLDPGAAENSARRLRSLGQVASVALAGVRLSVVVQVEREEVALVGVEELEGSLAQPSELGQLVLILDHAW